MTAMRRAWQWEPTTYWQVLLLVSTCAGLPILIGTYIILPYIVPGINKLGISVSDALICSMILGIGLSSKVQRRRRHGSRTR
jgi:hypothetical protein